MPIVDLHPALIAALAIVLGYLLGSIPFAFIAAKYLGVDLREYGSGNIGATNLYRIAGWSWAFPVLVLDALKGTGPVLVVDTLLAEHSQVVLYQMLTGFVAVIGHTYPIWLKGHGGRGVATGLGVVLALFPAVTGIAALVFAIALLTVRIMSVSSMAAAFALIPSFFLFYNLTEHAEIFMFLCVLAVFVIVKHRANIGRLLNGEEPKVQFRKKTEKNHETN